jgi:hypothetical protein
MPVNSPAINGSQSTMALHPNISATGIKGFLMWMKSDPTMSKVYQNIAPQLPSLLSTYGFAGTRKKRLGALGCCCYGIYCSGGSVYCGSSCASVFCSGGGNVSDSITAAAPTCSTNSSSLTGSLASLLNMAGGAVLGAAGQSVVNAQLSQAAAGKAPLALSVGGTVAASSLSSTTLWLLLGGGALLLVMMSSKKGSAS